MLEQRWSLVAAAEHSVFSRELWRTQSRADCDIYCERSGLGIPSAVSSGGSPINPGTNKVYEFNTITKKEISIWTAIVGLMSDGCNYRAKTRPLSADRGLGKKSVGLSLHGASQGLQGFN